MEGRCDTAPIGSTIGPTRKLSPLPHKRLRARASNERDPARSGPGNHHDLRRLRDRPAKGHDLWDTSALEGAASLYCLWCCNGRSVAVSQCTAVSCSLWQYRSGRKPRAGDLARLVDHQVYPLEDMTAAADFQKTITRTKAIRRKCLDCAGGSRAEVRACPREECPLHALRLGKNPNRGMSAEQRLIAAARLKKVRAKRRRTKATIP